MSDSIKKNYRKLRAAVKGLNAKDALDRARDFAAKGKVYESAAGSLTNNGAVFDQSGERWRWIENPSRAGFRFVGFSDEILPRLNHRGWFTNVFQDEVLRGAVYQLSAKDGAARFYCGLPDLINGEGGAFGPALICVSDHYRGERWGNDSHNGADNPAAQDAARAADNYAESAAESEREYTAAWQAGVEFGDLLASEKESRRKALAIFDDLRRARRCIASPDYAAICAAARDKIKDYVDAIHRARAQRARLKSGEYIDEYRPGFDPCDSDLLAAFNEGAGI